MPGVIRRSPWFNDWVDLGISGKVLNAPHGRLGYDTEASTSLVIEEGSRLARFYLYHGFLTPSPGVTADSFLCAFNHAMSGQYGDQWWSEGGYFYPPDHGLGLTGADCMPIVGGPVSMEVQSRQAGFGLVNTADAGDYLQGNSNSFALAFHLREWVETWGPDAGWGLPVVPDGATLEWEYDTPEVVGFDAAGDEDTTVHQTGVFGSPVAWRTPNGGLSAHYEDGHWFFQTGDRPAGPPLAVYSGSAPSWFDISWALDMPYLAGATETTDRDFDLIATATSALEEPRECPKPGSLDMYRYGQWLALRLRMRARRYRFVYTEQPVTRQWPRDSLGLAAGTRQFPPVRGQRIVGGHQ